MGPLWKGSRPLLNVSVLRNTLVSHISLMYHTLLYVLHSQLMFIKMSGLFKNVQRSRGFFAHITGNHVTIWNIRFSMYTNPIYS